MRGKGEGKGQSMGVLSGHTQSDPGFQKVCVLGGGGGGVG